MTTQRGVRTDNPKLTRNFGTQNRILRYKRIIIFFFMYTLFAMNKAGKPFQGHTCCQLFVTNKGFVCVVPIYLKV